MKGVRILKYLVMGATAILSGIMLFGMTWIAAAVYTTRGGEYGIFAEALSAIGYLRGFLPFKKASVGICFFVMAFNKHLEDQ